MKRRVALLMLFVGAAEAGNRMGARAGRSGSPPPPPPPSAPTDVPGPAGSASFTVNFGQLDAGSDGIVVLYSTSSVMSDDPDNYPYRKVFPGSSLTSGTVPNLAAGTYYARPAGYTGSTIGFLSQQIQKTAA